MQTIYAKIFGISQLLIPGYFAGKASRLFDQIVVPGSAPTVLLVL
jgi:hypothetical protein